MSNIKVALAGNPNVGKSTIFNALTGLRQHTGNWTGKTVDNAKGIYTYNENNYDIYDLPGTYSIIAHSKEELIARDFICFGESDITVVVCNAMCLERSLNLALQILEITTNVIIVVNLMDEAKKKNIDINIEKLSNILNTKVIPMSATNNEGIEELKKEIEYLSKNKNNNTFKIDYGKDIEKGINNINKCFYNNFNINKRFISIRLLSNTKDISNSLLEYKNYDIKENNNLIYNLNKNKEKLKNIDIDTIIVSKIINKCKEIKKEVITINNQDYLKNERKIDKILTNKITGIPIMLICLFVIFYLTIIGSNYPSELLSNLLFSLEDFLYNLCSFLPNTIRNLLINGVYRTTSWVVSVMLPPMLIFFPLFTIAENIGFLPRIAFNMDNCFRKCNACGKQCLTMAMGIGCNAVGVSGCRIIDSKRERLIAIITNSFMPCNGRYPTIIAVITMFFIGTTRGILSSIYCALILVLVILLGIIMTFIVSKILSHTLLKGETSSFILELPNYRKVHIGKIIIESIKDRVAFVLSRAVLVAMPTGLIIWLLTNININGVSILHICSNFLDKFALLIGLDGVILLSFILGIPANEIVLPIMLMTYLGTSSLTNYESISSLKTILIDNGWTTLTAICFIVFSIFHSPCSTTLLTIKKETNSWYYTFISFIIPVLTGTILCFVITTLYKLFII